MFWGGLVTGLVIGVPIGIGALMLVLWWLLYREPEEVD